MKQVYIYEPSMCCPTGLCGVGVDPELMRISTVVNNLKKEGIEIQRSNLTSSPMQFMTNPIVNQIINDKGVDELPLTLVNNQVFATGRYPTNKELSEILDIPLDLF